MLRDIKKCLQLIKYSFDFKKQIIWMIAMFVGGGVLLCISKGTAFLAGYFMILAPVMLAQMISNMGFSDLVKSSKLIKACTVHGVCAVSFVGVLIIYILTIVNALVWTNIRPDLESSIAFTTMLLGIMYAIIMIYFIVAGKFYWAGFVLFIVSFMITYFKFIQTSDGKLYLNASLDFGMSTVQASLIGLVAVLVAGVVAFIFARAAYKYPISKMAQFSSLRKQLR